MKMFIKLLLLGFCLSSLTGCAWWSKYTYGKVKSNIIRCKTSEADVRRIYGDPYTTGAQSSYMALTWFYSRFGLEEYGMFQRRLVVFVNSQGIVVDYALNPRDEVLVMDKCSP